MEKIKDFDNKLLNRREVKIIVDLDKTPSTEEAVDMINKEFKGDKEAIVIKEIRGKFGRKTFLIGAFIYTTKDDKEKIEIKTQKQRKAEAEAKKKAEEEAKSKEAEEAKAKEVAAEEKKEESKEKVNEESKEQTEEKKE